MNVRASILGPTGYTGLWLIDLLLRHPSARLTYLASARQELPNIADEFPQLLGRCDLTCRPIDPQAMAADADVVFVCLPHRQAMQYVPHLLAAGLRVIDLSADYRVPDAELYEQVYEHTHTDAERLDEAVYGLPELVGDAIVDAQLVANPGCYPTAALLAVAPLLQHSVVKHEGIVINAASGITGAGRGVKPHLHFPEMNQAFAPYAPGSHRHQPEIEFMLGLLVGRPVPLLFVPHYLPIDCGILETIYFDPIDDEVTEDDVFEALEDAYAEADFVRVRATLPNVKHVRGTNFCDISACVAGGKVIVFSALDNMVKGAAGQAVQNMNLMFKLDQTAGLL